MYPLVEVDCLKAVNIFNYERVKLNRGISMNFPGSSEAFNCVRFIQFEKTVG